MDMDFEQGKKFNDQKTEGPQYIYLKLSNVYSLCLSWIQISLCNCNLWAWRLCMIKVQDPIQI